MAHNRLAVITVFLIVLVVCGVKFYRYYITIPAQEAQLLANGADQQREYFRQHPPSTPGIPPSQMGQPRSAEDEAFLRYVLHGDEQARDECLALRKQATRRKHRTSILINLLLACVSAVVIAVEAVPMVRRPVR